MFKKISSIVLTLALILIFSTSTFVHAASPSPSSTAEAKAQKVDSFDLFWPLAPGRTVEDKLYRLKLLKEKVRGFFIFGAAQKADYKVFLATKRALEAESLFKKEKIDLANKTLDSMNDNLRGGYGIWQGLGKKDISVTLKTSIAEKLTKLDVFLKYFSSVASGDSGVKIESGLNKVHDFQYSLSL